jgi:hypothetical protein
MKFDLKILDDNFTINKKKSYLQKEFIEIIIKDIDEIIEFGFYYLENIKIKGKNKFDNDNENENENIKMINKKILKFLISDNNENLDNLFKKFKEEMFSIKSVLCKNLKIMV